MRQIVPLPRQLGLPSSVARTSSSSPQQERGQLPVQILQHPIPRSSIIKRPSRESPPTDTHDHDHGHDQRQQQQLNVGLGLPGLPRDVRDPGRSCSSPRRSPCGHFSMPVLSWNLLLLSRSHQASKQVPQNLKVSRQRHFYLKKEIFNYFNGISVASFFSNLFLVFYAIFLALRPTKCNFSKNICLNEWMKERNNYSKNPNNLAVK